jgi:oxalate decarboxylase/phosphoglucose isomerase-like protein (cupin superfamily)
MPNQTSSPTEPADRIRVGSDEITLRVTSDATRGSLLAADVRMPGGGGPPAMHRHDPDEIYRVQRGELAIYLEDEAGDVRLIRALASDVVHIPGGRAHTIRNESEAEAEAYVVFAPGAEMERFVRAAGALAEAGPFSVDDVLAVAERHGIRFTGPVATG